VELHCLRWQVEETTASSETRPVVLLHGGGANAHWWDHLAARLAARRPVYALDFRGHGDSSHPEDRRVGAFNTDLEGLVTAIGHEDVHLVGHSLGAAVALDHASRFEATRSLVLIDLSRGGSAGSRRRARLALSLRRTYPSFEEAVARFRFLPESSHPTEALRSYIAHHSIREEANGRFGYKFDPRWFALPTKPRPDLERVLCPTLLIRGEESGLLSREAAAEFVAHLSRGRWVEIERAGHHVLLDQPARLLEILEAFLAETSVEP
jgi:pimeloyl-ACP methyl ester carboxylesterase